MNGTRWILALVVVSALAVAWPSLANLSGVAGLFQAGRYDDARQALQEGDDDARPGEDVLWRSRLATKPAEALSLLESGIDDSKASEAVRIRLALEMAEIHAGRGNHGEALAALTQLLGGDSSDLPGAVYLRAALSLRARGQLQQAREMLASVRPGDPEFVLARYYLGDIGLEQNDAALALRYFEAAAKASTEQGTGRLGAGLWRAHMAGGQQQEANELVAALTAQDPGGLALLEIRRLIQAEADERDARRRARAPGVLRRQVAGRGQDLDGRRGLRRLLDQVLDVFAAGTKAEVELGVALGAVALTNGDPTRAVLTGPAAFVDSIETEVP